MAKPGLEGAFADFKEREALAESMIPMIGTLYRRNVVIYIHGVPLYNQSVIELMKAHRFVRQIEKNEMSEFETHPMLENLSKLDLGPQIQLAQVLKHWMGFKFGHLIFFNLPDKSVRLHQLDDGLIVKRNPMNIDHHISTIKSTDHWNH